MTTNKNNVNEGTIKKYMTLIKDLVFLIGILVSLGGWLYSQAQSKAVLKATVEKNTKTLEKLDEFMKEQYQLNGKFIQYMSMDSKNN